MTTDPSLCRGIRVGIVSTGRADYGLLRPLIVELKRRPDFEPLIIISGAHLIGEENQHLAEVNTDKHDHIYSVNLRHNRIDTHSVGSECGVALIESDQLFRSIKLDLLIVLGDRTELLGIVVAARFNAIPICHLHGGEVSLGAVDDDVRHCISKLSWLHFASSDLHRDRLLQLGESEDRVFNYGAIGLDTATSTNLLTNQQLNARLGNDTQLPLVVVSLHPETNNKNDEGFRNVFEFLITLDEYFLVFSEPNYDQGRDYLMNLIQGFINERKHNYIFKQSFGIDLYQSCLKHCRFAIGNSSSLIIEGSYFGTPSINVAGRQEGRQRGSNIIDTTTEYDDITNAFSRVLKLDKTAVANSPFWQGGASAKIVEKISELFPFTEYPRKRFVDRG